MKERPILAAMMLLTFFGLSIVALAQVEPNRFADIALGAVISWVTQIIFFYFRKKEAG